MNKTDITRFAIKIAINKAMSRLKHDPERTTRNLIDIALSFSKGRFQTAFFNAAKKLLEDENSQYYTLVKNIAFYIDPKRVKIFGVNLGYNSCTLGARTIREIEEKEDFNIPWSIIFDNTHINTISRIIDSGKELGIFTYCIFSSEQFDSRFIDLISKHDDCAIALFLDPININSECIEQLKELPHVMLMVSARNIDSFADTALHLQNEKFLYGCYLSYEDSDEEWITSGEWITETSPFKPVMSILLAGKNCSQSVCSKVKDYSLITRDEQSYPTFIIDLYSDLLLTNSIISGESYYLKIDSDGFASSNLPNAGTADTTSLSLKGVLRQLTPCRNK